MPSKQTTGKDIFAIESTSRKYANFAKPTLRMSLTCQAHYKIITSPSINFR